MILVGKAAGKPKYGCPFCSASTPYTDNCDLYTLQDLLNLHQVSFKLVYTLQLNTNICIPCRDMLMMAQLGRTKDCMRM